MSFLWKCGVAFLCGSSLFSKIFVLSVTKAGHKEDMPLDKIGFHAFENI